MRERWDDDRDPLVALSRGDSRPFEAFVQAEAPTFLAFFQRLGASRPTAEDLVQEVFLKLFRHAETYDPKGRFAAFAFRIARNAWIDRSRRVAAESPAAGLATTDPSANGRLPAPEAEPADDLERREEAARLVALLSELSDAHRLVFELGVVQELSYSTIAETLDIPVGTVKSRMFYAIKKLREGLAEPERTTGDDA